MLGRQISGIKVPGTQVFSERRAVRTVIQKLVLFLLLTLSSEAAEFSKDKIHHYASLMRIPEEGKMYLRFLGPDDVEQIVDQLDFSKDDRGKNMHFFAFALSKIEQFEGTNIDYGKDEAISRLVEFLRSCMEKGDVDAASDAISSFERLGIDHPDVIALAQDLRDGDHEFARENAKKYLESQESGTLRKREDSRSDKRSTGRNRLGNDSLEEEGREGPSGDPLFRNPWMILLCFSIFYALVLFVRFYKGEKT